MDVRYRWRRLAGALALALVASILAGCPGQPDPREYLFGVARIGDAYQVFTPLCADDGLIGVRLRKAGAQGGPDWWHARVPKDPAAPGEFWVLGVNEPFLEAAGGGPAPPAEFEVSLIHTDHSGSTYHNTGRFTLAAVPPYPARADVRQIRYAMPNATGKDLVGPDEIRQRSDCATGGSREGRTAPNLQPAGSFRPGAPERVRKALLARDAVGWMKLSSEAEPDVDIAGHACGHGPQTGALVAAFGLEQVWQEEDSDRRVTQFAGVYGATGAADAIGRVNDLLGCGEYTRHHVRYTSVGRIGLSPLPGTDRQLLYCERGEDEAGLCTLLLARRDILSRIEVTALTEEEALAGARALADDAAEALARI